MNTWCQLDKYKQVQRIRHGCDVYSVYPALYSFMLVCCSGTVLFSVYSYHDLFLIHTLKSHWTYSDLCLTRFSFVFFSFIPPSPHRQPGREQLSLIWTVHLSKLEDSVMYNLEPLIFGYGFGHTTTWDLCSFIVFYASLCNNQDRDFDVVIWKLV